MYKELGTHRFHDFFKTTNLSEQTVVIFGSVSLTNLFEKMCRLVVKYFFAESVNSWKCHRSADTHSQTDNLGW